jgi:hypothetical protein
MRAWLLTIVVGIAVALSARPAAAEFRAAIASRDVTPNPILPVTSGGPARAAEEVKGKLEVRALVLDDGQTRVAIVSEPFLGFPAALCRRVTGRVTAIPAENILIGATHTHGAPDPYGFPSLREKGGANMEYLTGVCEKTGDAINEAVEKLQPVQLKIATGKAQGKIAYNYYAPQLYDPRCHVIQALDASGKPIATLVNYAIHPEILLHKPIVTPDLVGPLYDRIEAQGGGMGIFMNSAEGGMVTADVRTPNGDLGEWSECVRIGGLLADEALRIVTAATPLEDPKLYCTAKEVRFPLPTNPMYRLLALSPVGFKVNEDGTVSTRINAVNVGNAQILTIPGEALPNIGYYLKRKMHGTHNMLFGLTNDAFGYILTKVDFNSFDRYKYVSQTGLGEMTGEIYMEEALKLVDSIPRPQQPSKKATTSEAREPEKSAK